MRFEMRSILVMIFMLVAFALGTSTRDVAADMQKSASEMPARDKLETWLAYRTIDGVKYGVKALVDQEGNTFLRFVQPCGAKINLPKNGCRYGGLQFESDNDGLEGAFWYSAETSAFDFTANKTNFLWLTRERTWYKQQHTIMAEGDDLQIGGWGAAGNGYVQLLADMPTRRLESCDSPDEYGRLGRRPIEYGPHVLWLCGELGWDYIPAQH